jgi:hypothetical protein
VSRVNIETLSRGFLYDIVERAVAMAEAEGAEDVEGRVREILEGWAYNFVSDQNPYRRLIR